MVVMFNPFVAPGSDCRLCIWVIVMCPMRWYVQARRAHSRRILTVVAQVFIDKYTQVPRILGPIVLTLERIGIMCEDDPVVARHIDTEYGGVEALRREILRDFFRHGFDGSGDDGGSCVDGRLTSAWNWCAAVLCVCF